jgi:hypothetical protein
MNCFKYLTVFCLCVLSNIVLRSQDRICLENSTMEGKVKNISLGTVRYVSTDMPTQSMLLPLSQVLILFNSAGEYVVPAAGDTAESRSKALFARFSTPAAGLRTKDMVFTLRHGLFEAKLTREDANYIYWGDTGKTEKKDLAVIIYNNGLPKIYCSNRQAAQLLASSHLELNLGTVVPAASGGSAGVSANGQQNSLAGNDPNAKGDTAANALQAKLLGDITPDEFRKKAAKKTEELTGYLKKLCDNSVEREEVDETITQALSLFVNEDAVVEVSSNNRDDVVRQKIRTYLNHLKLLRYDYIEIKWTHVQFVGDLKVGPDGNLHGTVSFEQEFRAYNDNKLVYSDITIKHTNVMLKIYDKTLEGSNQKIWDILLSDISVSGTKSITQ